MEFFLKIGNRFKEIAMKVTYETFIVTLFYLILIAVIITPIKKVLNSPTAFEEYELLDDSKISSFTFCPYPGYNQSQSIETFEEAMSEIDSAKKKYSATMYWSKSYTKGYISFYLYQKGRSCGFGQSLGPSSQFLTLVGQRD